MKKVLLSILFIVPSLLVFSQKQAQITINKLTNDEGKIFIDYSIINNKPKDLFEISVIVKHKDGT